MSAQNTGRQSPEPSRQSGAQQRDVPGSGKSGDFKADNPDVARNQHQSDQTKQSGLQSNPTSAMDANADKSTGKDGRGVDD